MLMIMQHKPTMINIELSIEQVARCTFFQSVKNWFFVLPFVQMVDTHLVGRHCVPFPE